MIVPVGDTVVVRRDDSTLPHNIIKLERIIVPDTLKHKSRFGTVVRVGPDVRAVKAGDKVVITWYDGTPHEDPEDGKVELFKAYEMLAVIE